MQVSEDAIIGSLKQMVSDMSIWLEPTRERSLAKTKMQEAIMWLEAGADNDSKV